MQRAMNETKRMMKEKVDEAVSKLTSGLSTAPLPYKTELHFEGHGRIDRAYETSRPDETITRGWTTQLPLLAYEPGL